MASFNISSTCNGRSWSPSFSVALAYQVYYCYGSYSTLHSLKATDQPSPSDVPEAVLIRTFLTTQPSDGSCNYEWTILYLHVFKEVDPVDESPNWINPGYQPKS